MAPGCWLGGTLVAKSSTTTRVGRNPRQAAVPAERHSRATPAVANIRELMALARFNAKTEAYVLELTQTRIVPAAWALTPRAKIIAIVALMFISPPHAPGKRHRAA